MSLTQQSLEVGKKGINSLFFVEAENIPAQYKDVVGTIIPVNESFYRAKQLAGLAPATVTNEGSEVQFDDMFQIYQRDFYPVLYTKGLRYSKQTEYTDQYNAVAKAQPEFAKAFVVKKNQVAANLDNEGFTVTTYGMNSESLYSTSHTITTGLTGTNRPATDIALGPLTLEQGLVELRKQKSARNVPMHYPGKVLLKVPLDLEPLANRLLSSDRIAGSADNDSNYTNRERVGLAVIDYYTSTTAWFLRAMDNGWHGLFLAEQMPYSIDKLPMGKDLMHVWVGSESYVVGWKDWHGTWGTTGS